MKLTPKQEDFAQAVASGKTQSDAYRSAYGAEKTKAASVQQSASRVMANVKVSSRVAELREPAVKKAQMTLESHLDDLKGLRNMAVKKEQFSAAIAAEVARGKASGLYVEKVAVTGNLFDSLLATVNGSSLKVVPDEQPG